MTKSYCDVEVTQINLNKCYLAQVDVTNRFKKQKNLIAGIQEPYCYRSKAINLATSLTMVASQDSPRAMILGSKNLGIQEVTHLCSKDSAVAFVRMEGRGVLIASAYLDITANVISAEMTKIIEYADSRRLALLIMLDSNAHSQLWMSKTNNARGRYLTDYIIEHSLKVENVGTVPTYECKLGKSIIDITLSRGLPVKIVNWRVDRGHNHSDHNTIRFGLRTEIIEIPPHRVWDKTDWKVFQEELRKREVAITSEINSDKLEKIVKNLYGCMEAALNKACPMVKGSTINLGNPWFTKNLEAKRKEVFALYAKYKDSGFTRGGDIYRKKERSYKKHCSKVKNKYRQKYKESLADVKEMAEYVRKLEGNRLPNIGTVKRKDGIYTLPGEETLSELANIHFPGHNKNQEQCKKLGKVSTAEIRSSNCDWINKARLTTAFNDFKAKKSPGTDGLKPVVLKYLTDAFLDTVVFIYKAIIVLGYTPLEWTKARVVFIPKPGKDDYTNPKAYRPISLTNYMVKGLEKLCRWKVNSMLELHSLNKNQHGFTKGLCTETAISKTVNMIEQRIMNGQYCLGVFLDIQAAFDSIDPLHIRRSLLNHGCPEDIANWYFNYLTYRVIKIQGREEEYTTIIKRGFPQGGVCSASFWAIAYNPAVNILNARGVTGQVYADDSCALIGGNDIDWMFQRMNQVLMQLEAWGQTCGLKFNPLKTEAILFSRDNPKRRKFVVPKLKMGGKCIELTESVKYLGVTLDRRLVWDEHVSNKVETCRKLMMKFFSDVRGNFGPKPSLIKWAYEGIVRPKLAYAALVWGHEVKTKAVLLKLRALDRLAIKAMVTLVRTAPQAGAEVILGLMPLELFIQQCGVKARIRLGSKLMVAWDNLNASRKTHVIPHLWHWERKLTELGLSDKSNDVCFEYIFDKNYTVNTESFDGKAKHRSHAEIMAYTDGSKTEQGVGAGYVLYRRKQFEFYESLKLPDHATVFQAEVMAINKCAEYLLKLENPKFVKILVDSQAALLALASSTVTSKLVLQTMGNLEALVATGCAVRLAWVKAHVGLEGNELADEAAKLGAADDMGILRKPEVWVPFSGIKSGIKSAFIQAWADRWNNDTSCKMTKDFFLNPMAGISRQILRHGKAEVSRLVQIITGHNFLGYFQSKLDPQVNPMCRLCGEDKETFFHLITGCQALEVRRRELFTGEVISSESWKPWQLLEFSYLEPVHSWLTDKGYLMEQPQYELEVNYSITDSDGSL